MRQYYPTSKILANTFALTPQFFYVYKIVTHPSGHFYIGYTGDPSSRMSQHIHKMGDARYASQGECSHFYSVLNDLFPRELDSDYYEHLKIVRGSLHVTFLAICVESSHAKTIEKMAIKENISNPLCLNTAKR